MVVGFRFGFFQKILSVFGGMVFGEMVVSCRLSVVGQEETFAKRTPLN